MIDVAALREAYSRHEIDQIGLLRGNKNIADAFTKTQTNKKVAQLVCSNNDNTDVVQWVDRNDVARF